MSFNIEPVFSATARNLHEEFMQIAQQIDHKHERGIGLEGKLRSFLSNHLPQRYNVTDGTVVARVGDQASQSKQIDVVIRDRFWSSEVLNFGGTMLHPIESVYGVISVKSRLDYDALRDSYENLKSVQVLAQKSLSNPDTILPPYAAPGDRYPLFGGLFAYDLGKDIPDLNAIKKRLRALDEEYLREGNCGEIGIGCICVLGHGIIAYSKSGKVQVDTRPNLNSQPVVFPDADKALIRFYALMTEHLAFVPIHSFGLLEYAPPQTEWGGEF